MGVKYSLAAVVVLAGVWGAAGNSFALTAEKVTSVLAAEGYSSIWRVEQGDETQTFGRWVTAIETPRQISADVCSSRQIDLGVREANGAVVFRKVTGLVALRNCQETEPQSFARVFGVADDKRLADIAHAIVLFLETQSARSPNVFVEFQDDAAKELAKLGASGRLIEIDQLGNNQASATIEMSDSKRHLIIGLRFEGDFLSEIRASEDLSVRVLR